MKPSAAFEPAKPPALGVKELCAHRCEEAFCPQCHVVSELCSGVYGRRLPLDPENPRGGDTWLSFHCSADGKFALGCKFCHVGKFGRGEVCSYSACKLSNLLKHQESFVHRQAVARRFGRTVAETKRAPRLSSFKAVLEEKSKATANRHGIDGVGGRKKVAKLMFCLKEAYMNMQRKFMAGCKSIAIHQDVAGKRLLVKFVAASESLEYASGVLGACHVLDSGRGADGIALATKKIIQTFCTPLAGLNYDFVASRKRSALASRHKLCAELEAHICQHIEMYDTDAARDEMVAGRLLSSSNIVDGLDGYLPNVLIYKKDSTHAVKRFGGVVRKRHASSNKQSRHGTWASEVFRK